MPVYWTVCVRCKLKQILNWLFINLLVHLNSCVARLWMALFFRWTGFTHRGPELVRLRLRSQSANQAMWQLQLKGFEMRLRLVIEVSSSNAPGVTQLMRFPYRESDWRLLRPRNIALFTTAISFSGRSLETNNAALINQLLIYFFSEVWLCGANEIWIRGIVWCYHSGQRTPAWQDWQETIQVFNFISRRDNTSLWIEFLCANLLPHWV